MSETPIIDNLIKTMSKKGYLIDFEKTEEDIKVPYNSNNYNKKKTIYENSKWHRLQINAVWTRRDNKCKQILN